MGRRPKPALRNLRPLPALARGAAGFAGAVPVLLGCALAAALPAGAFAQQCPPDAVTQPLRLRFESRLGERKAAAGDALPVYGSSERLTGRTGRDSTLEGEAELRRAGTVLRADRITYYEADE